MRVKFLGAQRCSGVVSLLPVCHLGGTLEASGPGCHRLGPACPKGMGQPERKEALHVACSLQLQLGDDYRAAAANHLMLRLAEVNLC